MESKLLLLNKVQNASVVVTLRACGRLLCLQDSERTSRKKDRISARQLLCKKYQKFLIYGFAFTLAATVVFSLRAAAQSQTVSLSALRKSFLNPPDDARIMMRWWWFGPTVQRDELARELRVMKNAGLGGVEIQPVYPLELDDPQKGFRNDAYLSDQFLANVRFVSEQAKQLGLRVDVTLGSGWPYGGPHTPITEASARLRCDRVPVAEGEQSVAVPAMENGEQLIAAFLASGTKANFSSEGVQRLKTIEAGLLHLPASVRGEHVVLFFISSRTGQQVKRAGLGAEGYVLDHYDQTAITHHLTAVGDKLIRAFGPNPPHAVFSDSLEVYGADWTPNFLGEFQKRRGYDLTPFLPALVGGVDEQNTAVRHDWGKTLTELAEQNYLTPVREWAHEHHTLFRSQTYGEPPVILSSNLLVDLPEGEFGPRWRIFSTTRWAASVDHQAGRPVTSSETWTWLHSPAFRATPLDMKAEADLHFIEGVNQLVGHGWPYSPPSAGEPGYRFYASAVFNDHNPWFQVMPELARYMQRLSFLLRQGKQVSDVALYLPTDDAWANFTPGKTAADKVMETLIGPNVIPQILDAGYDFDFVDDRMIAKSGLSYGVVILPGIERMPVSTLERLRDFVSKGGTVIATRRLPAVAPGWLETKSETPQVARLVEEIFNPSQKRARLVEDESQLGQALREAMTPDFATTSGAPAIGFIHRKLPDAEIYFVVNTTNHDVETDAHARVTGLNAEAWDAFTGQTEPCSDANGEALHLKLAPYESRLIVFSKDISASQSVRHSSTDEPSTDISAGWRVSFEGLNQPAATVNMPASWVDSERTRYFSGKATYQKSVQIAASQITNHRVVLDFGPGEVVQPSGPPGAPGMRALLESPVRECAIVFVNDQPAGSVWRPPFEVDVTKFVRAGSNEFRLVVANTAINEIAGKALPSYRLLNLRYGERFVPQGFENIKPLPSGVVGPIHLVTR